jgi:hypothetical protein
MSPYCDCLAEFAERTEDRHESPQRPFVAETLGELRAAQPTTAPPAAPPGAAAGGPAWRAAGQILSDRTGICGPDNTYRDK